MIIIIGMGDVTTFIKETMVLWNDVVEPVSTG